MTHGVHGCSRVPKKMLTYGTRTNINGVPKAAAPATASLRRPPAGGEAPLLEPWDDGSDSDRPAEDTEFASSTTVAAAVAINTIEWNGVDPVRWKQQPSNDHFELSFSFVSHRENVKLLLLYAATATSSAGA